MAREASVSLKAKKKKKEKRESLKTDKVVGDILK